MNNNFEIKKINYSKTKRKFLFVNKEKESDQIKDDFNVEYNTKAEKQISLIIKIEKQNPIKAKEYGIADYLILYLILFVFIGISTLVIMSIA